MLTKLGRLRRRILRRFSRTCLLGKWLGLGLDLKRPESEAPGLIILQIDGLSRQQFDAALARNRLPFLKKMIQKGYFRRTNFYSGLPSTTPSVQAEVMYGVKCVVPAFQFLHRTSGRIFRMYEQEAASTIVREHLSGGKPLLTGGSSFLNIYSGGAEDSQCCAETESLTGLMAQIRPLRLMLTICLYSLTLLRITVLSVVELIVAVADMIRGIVTRRDWQNEIKFVPARILVSIILREWVRIVVKLSIAAGKPVIYANFLGYDEQSHRRGPSSAFAHWGLKRIDGVIREIFRSAQNADGCDYEVIVFSDHGQESVRIYEFEYGKTIQQAVIDLLKSGPLTHRRVTSIDHLSARGGHLDQWMRRKRGNRRRPLASEQLTAQQLADGVIVTAMGPLGHIYFAIELDDESKAEYARLLVQREHVPLVLYCLSGTEVYCRNSSGLWKLPADCSSVCGDGHLFVDEICNDLELLCKNPDSGDLIISGWDPDQLPMSFVQEHGAHGSIGTQETCGFALLPATIRFNQHTAGNQEAYLRGVDLHAAALQFLHPDSCPTVKRNVSDQRTSVARSGGMDQLSPCSALPNNQLRVMTYNTHGCTGMDGRCRPFRIADIIAESGADIVSLQEVVQNRERTQFVDQAMMIASRAGMYYRFFPVLTTRSERYGLAVLSRFPMISVREEILTNPDLRSRSEARGAMWVKLNTEAGPVHLINTHLGLRSKERLQQINQLLGELWLADIESREPVIFCGDLNAGPKSEVLRRLTSRFRCVQILADGHVPEATFASVLPVRRIDHILVSRHFEVRSAKVTKNYATRLASDHLPLCADLTVCHDDSLYASEEYRSQLNPISITSQHTFLEADDVIHGRHS